MKINETDYGFLENEISKTASGGTEITKRRLHFAIDQELLKSFQIVPSRVRDLKEDKIRIYWAHDLPNDPECEWFKRPEEVNRFHKFVWSSNWQFQQFQTYYGFPYDSRSVVIDTWMEPAAPLKRERFWKPSTINLFYASTPHRGLNILQAVFDRLCQEYDNIRLHVHSSFEIYGWKDRDSAFKQLYDAIEANPKAFYHGFTPHEELLEKMANEYHILAYPATWLETSCRVLMEAMSAGCFCVHPNYGALADTSGGLSWIYQGDRDENVHAGLFYKNMKTLIEIFKTDDLWPIINFNKQYVDLRFDFKKIKEQWEYELKSLLLQYPTVESRKVKQPTSQFVYRV